MRVFRNLNGLSINSMWLFFFLWNINLNTTWFKVNHFYKLHRTSALPNTPSHTASSLLLEIKFRKQPPQQSNFFLFHLTTFQTSNEFEVLALMMKQQRMSWIQKIFHIFLFFRIFLMVFYSNRYSFLIFSWLAIIHALQLSFSLSELWFRFYNFVNSNIFFLPAY